VAAPSGSPRGASFEPKWNPSCTTIHSPALPCHAPCKCKLASVFYLSTQTEAALAFGHLLDDQAREAEVRRFMVSGVY
jgi:hypothetical protein